MPDKIKTKPKPVSVFVVRATSESGYMEIIGAYSTVSRARQAREILAHADNSHVDFDIVLFDLDHMPDLEPKED